MTITCDVCTVVYSNPESCQTDTNGLWDGNSNVQTVMEGQLINLDELQVVQASLKPESPVLDWNFFVCQPSWPKSWQFHELTDHQVGTIIIYSRRSFSCMQVSQTSRYNIPRSIPVKVLYQEKSVKGRRKLRSMVLFVKNFCKAKAALRYKNSAKQRHISQLPGTLTMTWW